MNKNIAKHQYHLYINYIEILPPPSQKKQASKHIFICNNNYTLGQIDENNHTFSFYNKEFLKQKDTYIKSAIRRFQVIYAPYPFMKGKPINQSDDLVNQWMLNTFTIFSNFHSYSQKLNKL
ncbi:hypothetical protein HMPREF1594_01160 [Escherichia coli 907446]|nr:hypothetical protein HMPREF1594_01160 [Escherichia coli 907446]